METQTIEYKQTWRHPAIALRISPEIKALEESLK